jgi:type IV secretory pathway VirB2 component (pilin)
MANFAKKRISSSSLLLISLLLFWSFPSFAFAQTGSSALTDAMCLVIKMITGKGGKAIVALCLIGLSVGFFNGKVSWGLILTVVVGVAAMFGAPSIAAVLLGGGMVTCT